MRRGLLNGIIIAIILLVVGYQLLGDRAQQAFEETFGTKQSQSPAATERTTDEGAGSEDEEAGVFDKVKKALGDATSQSPEASKPENLLRDPNLKEFVLAKAEEKFGTADVRVYDWRVYLTTNTFYFYAINPSNPAHVDMYHYYADRDEWGVRPEKLSDDTPPVKNSVLLKDVPIEQAIKVMEAGDALLAELGEDPSQWDEDDRFGISTVYVFGRDGKFTLDTTVKTERADYRLKFDAAGKLIEKKRA